MKVAYFDCFAGASGDMILGSLLDAGLDLAQIKDELVKLRLDRWDLKVRKIVKRGIGGSQAQVILNDHDHHHRHLADIRNIISRSGLSDAIQQQSIAIFTHLAEAEARVHQTTADQIHFHEVGAMDSIIDITGAVIGIAAFGIQKVFCSPLHLGSGTVECAHGTLPVPTPATAEIIKGKPVYSSEVKGELLTPTGAAILTTLAADFGPMPPMIIEEIGYGAGTSDPAIPNLLRVMVGEMVEDRDNRYVEATAADNTHSHNH
jgi:uncharacterized protein (TIGR00299 family) protein